MGTFIRVSLSLEYNTPSTDEKTEFASFTSIVFKWPAISNASSLIFVTVDGISILSRPLQPQKASFSISITPSGIMTSWRNKLSSKAYKYKIRIQRR